MIEALIRGEADPERLADEARGSLRKKVTPLRRALEGRVTDHHRSLLGMLTDQLRRPEEMVERFTARIEGAMPPFSEAEARLMAIPGVGRRRR